MLKGYSIFSMSVFNSDGFSWVFVNARNSLLINLQSLKYLCSVLNNDRTLTTNIVNTSSPKGFFSI